MFLGAIGETRDRTMRTCVKSLVCRVGKMLVTGRQLLGTFSYGENEWPAVTRYVELVVIADSPNVPYHVTIEEGPRISPEAEMG